MILVILAGILELWLAGNRHPAGWGLAAAAHLLWLPHALAAGQPGCALAGAVLGLICLRNHRKLQRPQVRLLQGRYARRRSHGA
jgi:hypothetical protein